jgi:riboflavin kinase/FMN adenylyltransferase
VLCVIPFTLEFSRLTAETFVHDVLVEHLHASVVVVGENFRFGHGAAGDVDVLARLGRTFGFTVEAAPLVSTPPGSAVVSSTYIRACVDAGDVDEAARALGRPHRMEGVVVRGDQRGRELGYPTANLLSPAFTAVPADGVYAGHLIRRDGVARPAAISIGTNPTFNGVQRRTEAYVLDFDGDLYGEHIAIDIVARLREQRRYDGVEPLIAQIEQDVADTRAILARDDPTRA